MFIVTAKFCTRTLHGSAESHGRPPNLPYHNLPHLTSDWGVSLPKPNTFRQRTQVRVVVLIFVEYSDDQDSGVNPQWATLKEITIQTTLSAHCAPQHKQTMVSIV